jgi:hypothetical protein
MNNLQIAKVVYEATSALDTSAGVTAESKRWEELTDEQRGQAATEVDGLVSNYYHGAAPTASSDGISGDDKQLKDSLKQGIVAAFAKREQDLAQGQDKQEESVQSAIAKADGELAEYNSGTVTGSKPQPEEEA